MRTFILVLFCFCVLLSACGGNTTPPNVTPPGQEKSAKTSTLETGADVLQSKAPLSALNVYMDGFHFYNGHMQGQMEAHHYCAPVNEDFIQCVIFDGNGKDARLMGVEYIVSEKTFQTLPEEEKKLWHGHRYEVKSGLLVEPGLPDVAGHELMEKLISTYGKTWHTWHTDQKNALPVSIPQLMMGFTADGQIRPDLVSDRDRRLGVSTEDKKRSRADIPDPQPQPGANSWEQGEVLQLQLGKAAGKQMASTGH